MAGFGSILSGVTGLNAAQQDLDIIGNNLANADTTGYKSQSVSFEDLFYQTLQPATPSTQNVGGTDPIQVGFGTKVASINNEMTQGTLTPTGNQLDMGIQGAGFFEESDGTNTYFTRNGGYTVDSAGYLQDPATGFNVLRFGNVGEPSAAGPGFQVAGDERIQIPFGSSIPGNITQNVTLQGNLDATAVGTVTGQATANVTLAGTLDSAAAPGTTVNGTIQIYDSLGVPHTLSVTFDKVGQDANNNNDDEWTLTSSVLAAEGSVSAGSPVTLEFDSSGTLVTPQSGTAALTLDFSPSGASNSQPVTLNLSGLSETAAVSTAAPTTQDGVETVAGTTVPAAIQIFDSKGSGHTLTLTFTKTAANPNANPPTPESWSITPSIPASEGTLSGTLGPITFNTDGSLASTGSSSLTFDFSKSGASANQVVNFNEGVLKGFTGLTEFGGNSTAAATNQDGFASGTLTTVSIGADGTIDGVFTNGKTTALAQLAVAMFSNPAGLSREGNNLFSATTQSGQPVTGAARAPDAAASSRGCSSNPNVDVANDFTQLIIAQRSYEVNARTVTVSDQVLQDLTQIIR